MFGFFKSGKSDSVSAPAEPGVADPAAAPHEAPRLSWAQRLKQGMARTRSAFTGQIAGAGYFEKAAFGYNFIIVKVLSRMGSICSPGACYDLGITGRQVIFYYLVDCRSKHE